MNMETYRASGEGVKTPVRIVPSDRAGEPLGEWTPGQDMVVEDAKLAGQVNSQFNKNYGMQKRFFDMMGRMRGDQLVTVQVVVD